jgi:hypothetical protein
VQDDSHYECFCIRPTNGRADDQLRRNHSTYLKIVATGTQVRLYVNGAEQPALIVNDLKRGETHGQVALGATPQPMPTSRI